MVTTADRQSVARASNARVRDPDLEPIAEKVRRGERLTTEDGLALYETPDLWTVCALANVVRRRLHGDVAYYNVNRHLNYSNVCALSCSFCAFYRKAGADGAYEYSVEEVRAEALAAREAGATEMHIVGGLHPYLPLSYYTEMLAAIREAAPEIHIKAFTAVEIVHLARVAKRGRDGYEGIKSILADLSEAGLGSLPGGGAEVFDDRVHDEAYKGKIRAGQWLDVHRAAHELGLNSNATMLYGHIEERADRIRHLEMLREQQDRTLAAWADDGGLRVQTARGHDGRETNAVVLTGPDEQYTGPRLPTPETSRTGYFQTIIPLPFFPDDSALEHLPSPTGMENLRTLAISRLMLDNFPHVKAFWIMQGLELAQFMLQNGADDLDGTVVWYDITKLTGPTTHQETSVRDLQRAIRDAGFRPVERDTLYRPVQRDGKAWRVAT
ncbi:MAG: aminofutalosine synthase MqnE [Planctomycetes bacterium]|nr:aminofutalosine synthase MqnE [Planctomycetota bacterium]